MPEEARKPGLFLVLLAAAAVIPYLNILHNQLFLDDLDFIVNNLYLRDWRYFPKLFTESMTAGAGHASDYYRPAMQAAFLAGYSLWDLNPVGYHFLSILFHLLNTLLLYKFLSHLMGNKKIAFGTALLFAAHPVQTESVASASALGILLGMFFGLLALLFHLSRARSRPCPASPNRDRTLPWPGLLCAAAALLSKETMVVLPGLIFLMEFYFCSCKERSRPFPASPDRDRSLQDRALQSMIATAPYMVLAAGYVILRFTVLNFGGTGNLFRVQNIFTEHMSVRTFTFFAVFKELLSILAWPHPLYMERSTVVPIYAAFFAGPVIAGFLILSLMTALAAFLSFRPSPKGESRNPFFSDKMDSRFRGNDDFSQNVVPFGILWFLFCLAPVSNILIPISATIVESWLYMAMAGPALCLVYLLSRLPQASFALSLAVLCIPCAAAAAAQNRVWKDPIVFYEHTLKYAPQSARFRNNLAMAYADQMRYNEAIEQYRTAILMNDQYSETHHNLANALVSVGNWGEAEKEYLAAIRMNPKFFHSYFALSSLYDRAGKKEEALSLLRMGQAADSRTSLNHGGPSK